MTKQDFELIAFVVSTIEDRVSRAAVATAFVKLLVKVNPRFDVAKFAKACGL